jgi:hypothetical protein
MSAFAIFVTVAAAARALIHMLQERKMRARQQTIKIDSGRAPLPSFCQPICKLRIVIILKQLKQRPAHILSSFVLRVEHL